MYGGFDYYTILGIDHYATRGEIKQAYRRLAKQHHPDVNPNNPTAEEQFQKINEAYETLYDSSKRIKYDTGFDEAVREAYASGHYGASSYRTSDGTSDSASQGYHAKYTYTQSGYGYDSYDDFDNFVNPDFGKREHNINFADLSAFGKVEAYVKFTLTKLPSFHYIVLAALAILLLIIPRDASLSFTNFTGISMRLTFFIVHALFSSYWVERSCASLNTDFVMLPTMVMFTHAAASLISAMLTVIFQIGFALIFKLPDYLREIWGAI